MHVTSGTKSRKLCSFAWCFSLVVHPYHSSPSDEAMASVRS